MTDTETTALSADNFYRFESTANGVWIYKHAENLPVVFLTNGDLGRLNGTITH